MTTHWARTRAWLVVRSAERSRTRQLGVAAGAALALFAAYAIIEWPGAFTADSMLMAWQADGDAPTTTYHPMTVVGLYKVAIVLFGAAGPWIIQTLLMSAGFAALWTLGRPSRLRRLLAILLFVSPPWIAMTATVGKDALAASLVVLLAAIAMIRPNGRVAGPVAIAAAIALPLVRFNVFPLCALAVLVWPLNTIRVPTVWRAAGAVMLGLLLSVGSQVAAAPLATYKIDAPGTFQGWDLAGIATRTNSTEAVPPENQRAGVACTSDEIRAQYSPETSDSLIFPADACIRITKPEDYAELEQRKREGSDALAIGWGPWAKAIAGHPTAYAQHRLAVAGNLLGLSGTNQVMTAQTQHEGIALVGGSTERAPGQVVVSVVLGWTTAHLSALWAPWIAVILLGIALWTIGRRQDAPTTALLVALTSVVFLVTTLATVPGTDTRYMYPITVLAGISLITALTRGIES